MPINKKKMSALKSEYGSATGKKVYYAMENKEKGAKKGSKKAKGKKGKK